MAQDYVKSRHCNIGVMPYSSALAQDLLTRPPNPTQDKIVMQSGVTRPSQVGQRALLATVLMI